MVRTSLAPASLLSATVLLSLVSLAGGAGCGAAPDHGATLTRLREAITTPVADEDVMEEHNQLVLQVRDTGALEGLRQYEVEERIGRGEECGIRELCSSRGFRPTDWFYDVGRNPSDPSLPAGPSLIVGFDSAGHVDRVFTVTRSR